MSNVLVEENKLDILANAISNKSGEPLKLTLDEMVEAVDGIEQNTGITPTGNIDITHAGTTDVTNYATATVPEASIHSWFDNYFTTVNGNRKWKVENGWALADGEKGWVNDDGINVITFSAVPKNTTITPSTSSQTIGGANYMMEGAVTVNAVPMATVQDDSADWTFETIDGVRKCKITSSLDFSAGYVNNGWVDGNGRYIDAIPANWTVTPTESSQIVGGSSMMMEGAVTVNAIPSNYVGSGITQRSSTDLTVSGATVTAPSGYYSASASKSVANGTAGTPTATKGTVSNHSVSVTPSVTNTTGYITGGTKSGTAVSVSASELVSGTLNVTSAGTKDVTNYASASIPSGTAGTPTATKGTVSNHSVSVTPSVTNTTGFITGSTKSGTAVTVSASELVSGSETKTENGTYDVTNLAEIVVAVEGGGSSGVQVAVATPQSGANSYVTFGNLEGIPTSFSLINTYDITIDDTPIVSALTFDGTNYVGQLATNLSNANAHAMSTGFSHSYDSHYNQINISSENAAFDTYSHYILVYTYGGSASDIQTADVQVGSGATSITFPVNGRPTYWSCVFKSDFGTSSGYQRVIAVANDGTNTYGTYGLCLDSSVHASNQYWTASYSGGNLTISSQSTNAGGYFHQPGYYQLTYIVDESAPSYQTKTVTPTTSQQVVTPDSGYDALSQVTVNAIPSQYVIPSGNLAITQNGNNINVAQYATVSVNVSGGGGANIATATTTNSSNQNTSISFTLPSGRTPKAFFARLTSQIARSSNSRYYYVFDMRWDGSSTGGVAGNTFYMYSGTLTNVTSGYSYSQSGTTFTLSSTGSRSASPGSFYNGTYELVYIY